MASIEDLIATLSSGLHAGQHGNDIRDLHSKLAQTLNNPVPHPHYRPIPPPVANSNVSSASGMPPPAPASSWNTPPPNTGFLFSSSPFSKAQKVNPGYPSGSPLSGNDANGFAGGGGDHGWTVPMPSMSSLSNRPGQPVHHSSNTQHHADHYPEGGGEDVEELPYHAAVLPIKASPKDTSGFAEDAFKPLWDDGQRDQWGGFKQQKR